MMAHPTASPTHTMPKIGITLGDVNGIGIETILKCLLDARILNHVQPVLIGAAQATRIHANKLGLKKVKLQTIQHIEQLPPSHSADTPAPVAVLDTELGQRPTVSFGKVTEVAGRLAMRAVEVAIDLCKEGLLDGMVTAPISKEAIALAGYQEAGHTDFIAKRVNCEAYTMMMISDELRVGLVTTHVPISEVAALINEAHIRAKIEIITRALQTDYALPRPKIAVLGLNPHAGDGGVIGKEEVDLIMPTLNKAQADGYLAYGPFPSDGFFASHKYRHYDAVLAMYHDQGLIPFKAIAFETGINYTAGLPIVRTSPDHGTAFDIAGQGIASPDSMRHALFLATDIARRRNQHAAQKEAA